MINLIPPAARQTMKREYWFRVGIVWVTLLIFVLLAAMVLLVPSFVLVETQLRAYESQLQTATQAAEEQEALTDMVRSANTQAQIVHQFGLVDPFSRYIDHIQELQNDAITIRQFELARDGAAVASVTIVGVAANRNSLTTFSAALNNDPLFSEANVPLSNLAANEDISFVITVTVSEPS